MLVCLTVVLSYLLSIVFGIINSFLVGDQYHFFICHHQRSGGDQVATLCRDLEKRGYSCWVDNTQHAEERNLDGMRRGVRDAQCFVIFLSGRKETNRKPDAAGQYEGTFTSWYCHQEMKEALDSGIKIIGIMETEDERGKPDFNEEKRRCEGVSEHSEQVVKLLDQVCFTPYRRQRHEVDGMLDEIVRQSSVSRNKAAPKVRFRFCSCSVFVSQSSCDVFLSRNQ